VTLQGFQQNNSHTSFTSGYCQWRFGVFVRIGIQENSCLTGAIVGLNGEFVHIAQLGANHLIKTVPV